jgi:membrane-associated phospholipid phosphatase
MTENLLDAGIAFILFLQSLGDWLIAPMEFFSFLGQEEFFLLVMPALYWCLDAGLGLRAAVMLMVSNGLNEIFKLVFRGPRPYFYTSQVRALSSETSFGIPSGHAQNAAALWGLLAARLRSRLAWTAAILVIFLIGLSRVFLAVHFPTDVLLGWLIGGLLIWAFYWLEAAFLPRLLARPVRSQVIAVFMASMLLILMGGLVRLGFGAWTLPDRWAENALQAGPEIEMPDPLAISGLFTNAGGLFGVAAGAILLKHNRGGFDARGVWWKRLLRYPIGLAGVLLLWFGLGMLFPRGELLLPYLLRYLRYALVGLWVIALAPALFIRLGLANWQRAYRSTAETAEFAQIS